MLVFHVVWKVPKLARNDPKHSNKTSIQYKFDFKYQFNSKPEFGKVNNVMKYKIKLKAKLV